MGAAVDGIDVVGEAEDALGVGVVVLQTDLDLDVLNAALRHFGRVGDDLHIDIGFVGVGEFKIDRLFVQDLLATIQVLNKFGNATVVLKRRLLGFARLGIGGALVGEGDNQALVEEGELAQTLG